MPPRAENGAAPAPAAALTPLSDEEVMATAIYKILMQFDTPKGIEVSASNKLWPNLADLPDVMFGTVDQWTHKARMKIKITCGESLTALRRSRTKTCTSFCFPSMSSS